MDIRSAIAALATVCVLGACASTETKEETAPAGLTIAATIGSQASSGTVTSTGPGGQPVGEAKASGVASGLERPDLRRSVYYEFDQDDVRAEYRPLVETHARWLRANPRARLTIEGNTDERGSREYNVALGQRRAEAVVSLMVLLGAKPEQIEAVSFGKEKPRAGGHDETAWAENRRSDFAAR